MLIWGLVESATVQKVVDGIRNMAKGYSAAYGQLPALVDVHDLTNETLVHVIRYAPDLIVLPNWSQLRMVAWRVFGKVVRQAHKRQMVSTETVVVPDRTETSYKITQLRAAVILLLPQVNDSVTRMLLQLLNDPVLWDTWECASGYTSSNVTTARVRAYVGARTLQWNRAVAYLKSEL